MKPKLLLSFVFTLAVCCSFAQTQVTFYTSKGSFVVSMEETKRPLTTANFLKLVKAKFYDKRLFYRVIKNFMIQGGSGGGSVPAIKDELTPAFSNLQKTIAMANAGPNTGSSEIYINLVNNTYLDPNYTAFGTVISNFTVVQAIGVVPTSGSSGNPPDKPLTDVVMDSVRITLTPTAINNPDNPLHSIDIFPNPTSGSVFISSPESIENIFITDILDQPVSLPEARNGNTIDLSSFLPGIYLLHLRTAKGVEVKKVIRQ